MREKILAQLVTKYPGVSKKFLGLYADKLAPKVTEESQIQGVVDELDNLPVPLTDLAAEYQREGDRRVSEAEKEWKKKNPSQQPPKTDDPAPADDDTPKWAKGLVDRLDKLEGATRAKSMQTTVAEKLKEIPARFYAGRALPESEDAVDAFVEEIKTEYTAFKQDLINEGLAFTTKPAGGTGGTDATAAQIDQDISAWAGKGAENKK